jgi:hypothetical protein
VGDVGDERAVTAAFTRIAMGLLLSHSSRNSPRDTMGMVAEHLKNRRPLDLPEGQAAQTRIIQGESDKIAGIRNQRGAEDQSTDAANVRAKMMMGLVLRLRQVKMEGTREVEEMERGRLVVSDLTPCIIPHLRIFRVPLWKSNNGEYRGKIV